MIKSGLRTSAKANLYVHGGKKANGGGVVYFWNNTLLPDLGSADRALGFQGTSPKYWNGTSWAAFSGGSGFTTWDELYANDKSLTISGTTLTFTLTHATGDGLTLGASAAATGQLLQFANSGSGLDIQGTSDTWSISSAGALTCVGITNTSDITTTGAAIDWDLIDNNSSALSFDASGKAGIIALVTTNSSEGVTMSGTLTVAGAVVCSTGVSSSDGTCTFTDDSNVANGLVFVNDTVTTYGNATDAGPVHFSSASLTTGALLNLSVDETALTGGFYIRGWDQDAGAATWSIGELGAMVLSGSASGTDVITCTAGDVTLTSGDLTITDGSIVLTNTADETVLTVVGDAVTTGNVIDVNADAVTSGTVLHLDTTAATFTGKYIDCYDGAASDFTVGLYGATIIAGNASGTDALTLTKGDITVTLGDVTLTNGSVVIGNAGNETALTVVADAVTTGIAVDINGDGVTTGTILHLDSTAAGLTTGKYLDCYDGAASDFAIGANGATVIAGSATGTDALTLTAGDITLTNGDVTLTDGDLILTANGSIISFTGTGANGGVLTNLKNAAASTLSGTQKDIEIDLGGTPYYFTVYPTKA